MYVYVCIYIAVLRRNPLGTGFTDRYIYVYLCIYIYVDVGVYVGVDVYAYMYIYVDVDVYVCICMYIAVLRRDPLGTGFTDRYIYVYLCIYM
jgi:hypothetical protein